MFTAVSSGVQPYSVVLVDWRAGVEQQLRGLDVSLARREDERRQSAAAAADQSGDHDLVVVIAVGLRRLRCQPLAACAAAASPASGLSGAAAR